MKIIFTIITLSMVVFTTFAQNFYEEQEVKRKLEVYASDMGSGIYERIIQKSEVDQIITYNRNHDFMPFQELNYLYLRFDFKFSDGRFIKSDDSLSIIGKVFKSERYVESDYYDIFKNQDFYKNNYDGFFYYCKLYFDVQNLDYRLIIYPKYIQNICEEYMHLNKKLCTQADSKTHENSILHLLKVPEMRFNDVISSNLEPSKEFKEKNMESYNKFVDECEGCNITKFDDVKNIFKKVIKRNMHSVILNHSKYLKVFKKIDIGTKTKLRLTYSKNANSEDFTYNLQYDYDFVSYDSLPKISDDIAFTRNQDNQNLMYSTVPNDKFYNGKKRVYSKLSFDNNEECTNADNGTYLNCLKIKRQDLLEKLDKIKLELEKHRRSVDTIQIRTYTEKEKEIFEKFKIKPIAKEKQKHFVAKNAEIENLKSLIDDNIDLGNIIDSDGLRVRLEEILNSITLEYNTYAVLSPPFRIFNIANIQEEIKIIKREKSKYERCIADTTNTNCKQYYQTIGLKNSIDSLKYNLTATKIWIDDFQNDLKEYQENIRNTAIRQRNLDDFKKIEIAYNILSNEIKSISDKIDNFDKFSRNDEFYLFIEKGLIEKYIKTGVFDDKLKFQFYNDLLSKPFYIRNNVPIRLETKYEKGRILEIYEPFNYSKKYVRTIFKTKVLKGKSWRNLMYENLYQTLQLQTFFGTIPWQVTTKANTFYAVGDYYWLKISDDLKNNLQYFNYLFFHHPQKFENFVRRKGQYKYSSI